MHNLPLQFVPARPCVSVVPWHTGEIRDVHVHRTTSTLDHIVPVAGLECTSVARTVIDLGREHGRPAGVIAADKALHEGWTTAAQLATTLADCRRWPGLRAARAAVECADGRAESPLESMSRLKLQDNGLPAPDLQTSIGTADGVPIARVDFYWDEFGVVGEADGMGKYDGPPVRLRTEKIRQEQLEDTGLIVVRWGWSELSTFDGVARRLLRAFARGQHRPVDDRRWSLLPTVYRPTLTPEAL